MKKIYFIIMIVLGFCSCNKEISDTVTSPAEVDVYVAGFVADDVSSYYSYPYSPSYSFTSSLHEKPTYWKNGSLVEIDSGSYGNNGYIGARALSIAVSGNNVYVAGFLTGWS